jgi:hypothetical protein
MVEIGEFIKRDEQIATIETDKVRRLLGFDDAVIL